MASPDRSTESTLKRIYESGKWSDLTISTETRDFQVHKNIVCPACPFFEAACSRDFKEAHTGVVNLPESAETVDGILRFIYGFQVGQATIEHAAAKDIDYFRACVDLHVASDKYDLPGLRRITGRSLTTYVCCFNKVSKLVNAALYIWHQDPGTVDDLIIEHLVFVTAKYLPNIRGIEPLWQALVSCEKLLTAAMDVVFRTTDWKHLRTSPGPDMEQEQEADYLRVFDGLLDAELRWLT